MHEVQVTSAFTCVIDHNVEYFTIISTKNTMQVYVYIIFKNRRIRMGGGSSKESQQLSLPFHTNVQ